MDELQDDALVGDVVDFQFGAFDFKDFTNREVGVFPDGPGNGFGNTRIGVRGAGSGLCSVCDLNGIHCGW